MPHQLWVRNLKIKSKLLEFKINKSIPLSKIGNQNLN